LLTKSPQKTGCFQRRIRFTRSARIGFQMILKNIDFGPTDTILLPAYIGITDREGSGVMDPVKAVHVKTEFYPVDYQLAGDLDYIRDCLASRDIKAILVIHYFGIAQTEMTALKTLCEQHNTVLIEDCAHAWRSSLNSTPLGEYGDYSFGSIHKYLAAHDGGFVKWRKGLACEGSITPEKEISTSSLAAFACADYLSIADIRLRNYKYLSQQLANQVGIKVMYPELALGIVPLNLPVVVSGMSREKLYFELIDRGFTLIALYHRLIPEIDREQFPISYWLSEKILNLPVHQDTGIEDLRGLVEALQRILSKVM